MRGRNFVPLSLAPFRGRTSAMGSLERCDELFLRLALCCVRDGLPLLPGGEAVGIGGAYHGQARAAEDQSQRRILRVHDLEDGFRGRLRIAAFQAPETPEDLLPQARRTVSMPGAIFSDAGLPNSVA